MNLYDTLNRLSTLTSPVTGAFGFSYDALSRRTQLTRPNGVNTNYTYDNVSRLLSVLQQVGANTFGYDSFGNLTASTGSIPNPYRYTGREFDLETGTYYYRARYYDAGSGRFLSEDPARFQSLQAHREKSHWCLQADVHEWRRGARLET